jgi:hypothetical protein
MSVEDETCDRPTCDYCSCIISYGDYSAHRGGKCILDKKIAKSLDGKKLSVVVAKTVDDILPDYKLIAERLWMILDDIDTASDHYKPNNNDKYVQYIYAKVKEKNDYMYSPDGYKLEAIPKCKIPVIEDLDPMTRWFKDAWKIEKENSK